MAEFHIEYIVHLTVEADDQVEAMMIGGGKLADLDDSNELADNCEFLDIEQIEDNDREIKQYRVGVFASLNIDALGVAEAIREAAEAILGGQIKMHEFEFEAQER